MKTEHLHNYSMNAINSFYMDDVVTQAQYEAYCWLWERKSYTTNFTAWVKFHNLEQDTKLEIIKIQRSMR